MYFETTYIVVDVKQVLVIEELLDEVEVAPVHSVVQDTQPVLILYSLQ